MVSARAADSSQLVVNFGPEWRLLLQARLLWRCLRRQADRLIAVGAAPHPPAWLKDRPRGLD